MSATPETTAAPETTATPTTPAPEGPTEPTPTQTPATPPIDATFDLICAEINRRLPDASSFEFGRLMDRFQLLQRNANRTEEVRLKKPGARPALRGGEIELCSHTMPSGRRCRSPRPHGSDQFCYFHRRLRGTRPAGPQSRSLRTAFPLVEDRASIQIALNEVMRACIGGYIDSRKTGLLLYGLQLAYQNVRLQDTTPLSDDPAPPAEIGDDPFVVEQEPEAPKQVPDERFRYHPKPMIREYYGFPDTPQELCDPAAWNGLIPIENADPSTAVGVTLDSSEAEIDSGHEGENADPSTASAPPTSVGMTLDFPYEHKGRVSRSRARFQPCQSTGRRRAASAAERRLRERGRKRRSLHCVGSADSDQDDPRFSLRAQGRGRRVSRSRARFQPCQSTGRRRAASAAERRLRERGRKRRSLHCVGSADSGRDDPRYS